MSSGIAGADASMDNQHGFFVTGRPGPKRRTPRVMCALASRPLGLPYGRAVDSRPATADHHPGPATITRAATRSNPASGPGTRTRSSSRRQRRNCPERCAGGLLTPNRDVPVGVRPARCRRRPDPEASWPSCWFRAGRGQRSVLRTLSPPLAQQTRCHAPGRVSNGRQFRERGGCGAI